ncbi:hypothetical protein Scep_002457 [Stephania cephalantha]|uniref:ABC transporter domain-containing protein n=1 Tax=Stephania cephalantha TaxID=152367 RepID=A0AAP0LA93_9MAGN
MKKQGCEIEAFGVNYTIYTKNNNNKSSLQSILHDKQHQQGVRSILKSVSCTAKPWEILAIIGPSGAGKSSLLEILAGRLVPDGDDEKSSSIFINHSPMDRVNFKKISGYVTQKDTLFPLLTVEETLMFTAKLRLGHDKQKLSSRVKALMMELGLDHVANTRIGDDRLRGISGGERRRVSIGVDVVHDPRVLILDEPTSGLDSTSALQIIDMLKIMAETRGRTVILSIHQPGFRIVKLFNSILLLANGTVLHQGTVDQLQNHLRSIGLELPLHVNTVEFAIEAIETLQQNHQSHHQQQQQHQQQQKQLALQRDDHHETNTTGTGKFTLQQLFQQSKVVDEESANGVAIDLPRGFTNTRFQETIILTHRFSKNIYRTKELFACRTIQMLLAGLVLGSIFYDLKDDLTGSVERVGLFAFILTFLLSCTTEALPIFLQEREILMKETSSGSYRVSSYVIANSLVYLPFLLILALLFSIPIYCLVGLNKSFTSFTYFLLIIWLIFYTANSVVVCFSALAPNFIVGNSVISGVMGSFFLFSGYFISKNEIPNYWIFMHYISLFKYPFEGLLINEFSGTGKCLDYMFGACIVSGEDVLREEGYGGEESRWRNVVIMVCFILLYRFASYVILRCRCSQRSLKKALIS